MKILAIDPGAKGVIIELDSDTVTARYMKMPVRADKIICQDALRDRFDLGSMDFITIEKISPNPKWASNATFEFGKTIGQLLAFVGDYQFTEIHPRRWQKQMLANLPTLPDPKARAKAAFQRLNPKYPNGKIDDNLVDAFLIAAYALQNARAYSAPAGWTFTDVGLTGSGGPQ